VVVYVNAAEPFTVDVVVDVEVDVVDPDDPNVHATPLILQLAGSCRAPVREAT
jgi:hypothetical protein